LAMLLAAAPSSPMCGSRVDVDVDVYLNSTRNSQEWEMRRKGGGEVV
jgi:hypothetical protein